MRTVKTKDELIKAIQDGERDIEVDSKELLLACKLAEKYHNVKSFLADYAIGKTSKTIDEVSNEIEESINSSNNADEIRIDPQLIEVKPHGVTHNATVTITGGQIVAITISVLVATVAIIAILKNREIIIDGDWNKGKGCLHVK